MPALTGMIGFVRNIANPPPPIHMMSSNFNHQNISKLLLEVRLHKGAIVFFPAQKIHTIKYSG